MIEPSGESTAPLTKLFGAAAKKRSKMLKSLMKRVSTAMVRKGKESKWSREKEELSIRRTPAIARRRKKRTPAFQRAGEKDEFSGWHLEGQQTRYIHAGAAAGAAAAAIFSGRGI